MNTVVETTTVTTVTTKTTKTTSRRALRDARCEAGLEKCLCTRPSVKWSNGGPVCARCARIETDIELYLTQKSGRPETFLSLDGLSEVSGVRASNFSGRRDMFSAEPPVITGDSLKYLDILLAKAALPDEPAVTEQTCEQK